MGLDERAELTTQATKEKRLNPREPAGARPAYSPRSALAPGWRCGPPPGSRGPGAAVPVLTAAVLVT